MKSRTVRVVAGLGCVALGMSARVDAQTVVPIRELSAPDAKSADHFGTILNVRPLAGGRLLVNDGQKRQLVSLDAKLGNRTIIIDSVAVGGQSYGPVASPLIPYLGDSSLFVDGTSASLLLISPNGAIVRVMAAPKPSDLRYMTYGVSGVDARGNLVYRGVQTTIQATPQVGSPKTMIVQPPDSAPILRANFETRTVDTVGRVKSASGTRFTEADVGGQTVRTIVINPLSSIDEWAVLSNGSLAFVRGHDYHVDFVHADGKLTSSPKLSFDWKRLTDNDKLALIDSARTAREKLSAEAKAGTLDAKGKLAAVASAGTAAPPPPGAVIMTVKGLNADGGAPGQMVNQIQLRTEYVPLKEIADYWPPIRSGAVKADFDGNLWILPTTSAQSKNGELIYDVVSSRGEMTQRVRIPAGRSIAGFGHNGVVYLMYKDASGWTLERTGVVANAGSSQP